MTVVVTGGASGIGAATVRAFAQAGARVGIADRDAARADALAREIGEHACAASVDVADEAAVEVAIDRIGERLGPIDVLVNNAGVAERTSGIELSIARWREVIEVNLTGAFICSRAVARRMAARGATGAIVNVASVAGLIGVPGRTAYVASKHGLIGLTRALAGDLAHLGIRVNAVAPGSVETPLTAGLLARPEAKESVRRSHPIGRWAQPAEIARAILFLASPHSDFITGAVLPVDGGYSSVKSI